MVNLRKLAHRQSDSKYTLLCESKVADGYISTVGSWFESNTSTLNYNNHKKQNVWKTLI